MGLKLVAGASIAGLLITAIVLRDRAPGRAFTAEIQEVSSAIGWNRSPARYEVVLTVNNPDRALREGMAVTVDLPMSSQSGSMRVAVGAVDSSWAPSSDRSARSRNSVLWVVGPSRQATPVSAETGVSDGLFIEIRSPAITTGQTVAMLSSGR